MSKGKKIYCIASFAFACAVLILTITLCMMHPGRVYASSMDPDSITKITQKDTQGADHNTDNANGLSITYNNDSGSVSTPIKMLLVLTILSLAPSILIMMTSFTRIIIVLHFLRTAIGTQTTPPNQVLIGLALFLTFFIMWPTFQQINKEAIQPLDKGEITQSEFFEKAEGPIREFMIKDAKIQIRDVNLFAEISGETYKDTKELSDVPFTTLVPAFILSELRKAFIMGFLIYIPFIVIDMVVSSVLMSMGMMMLPPTTISLPFKILLFVLADGWDLKIPRPDILLGGYRMISQGAVLDIARDAIYTILITSAPLLLVSLVVGLIISIFQTVTSIQEQTLTFVPKIIAVFAAMILCGSWMLNNMTELVERLWSNFSTYLSM